MWSGWGERGTNVGGAGRCIHAAGRAPLKPQAITHGPPSGAGKEWTLKMPCRVIAWSEEPQMKFGGQASAQRRCPTTHWAMAHDRSTG